SWMMGMPTTMPNVSRSRLSWMNSLPTMPSQREMEKKSRISVASRVFAGAAHQMNEHVLETGFGFLPLAARLAHERLQRTLQCFAVGAGNMKRGPESSDLLDFRQLAQTLFEVGQILTSHRPGVERLAVDDLVCGALRQKPPLEDIAELVAALGLVHVV